MLVRLDTFSQRPRSLKLLAAAPEVVIRTWIWCERIPGRHDLSSRNSLCRVRRAKPPALGMSLAEIAEIIKSFRPVRAGPRDWHIACGNCGKPRHGLPARYRERNEGGAERSETNFSPISIRRLLATLVTAMLASPTGIQAMVSVPPWPAFTPLYGAQKVLGQLTVVDANRFRQPTQFPGSALKSGQQTLAPRDNSRAAIGPKRKNGTKAVRLGSSSAVWASGNMWALWCPFIRAGYGEAPRAIRKFPMFSMRESHNPPSLVLTYSGLLRPPVLTVTGKSVGSRLKPPLRQ